MDLKENQAALILEASSDGEVTVDVQAQNLQGFASALWGGGGGGLMNDEQLQGELMDMVEAGEQPEKPAE